MPTNCGALEVDVCDHVAAGRAESLTLGCTHGSYDTLTPNTSCRSESVSVVYL